MYAGLLLPLQSLQPNIYILDKNKEQHERAHTVKAGSPHNLYHNIIAPYLKESRGDDTIRRQASLHHMTSGDSLLILRTWLFRV